MNLKYFMLCTLVCMLFVSACEDMGDPVSSTPPPTNSPTISSIVPDSGVVGDTVTISGTNFGSSQATSTISFGTINSATIVSWSDTQIMAVVPANAVTGNVIISVGGNNSNTRQFRVLGTVSVLSFNTDIKPLLNSYGCSGCHGSNGGLSVATVSSLLAGGNNGAAIVVNNADNSNLVKKLRQSTLPFGAKMPANGGNVSDADLQKIKDWINQGAND